MTIKGKAFFNFYLSPIKNLNSQYELYDSLFHFFHYFPQVLTEHSRCDVRGELPFTDIQPIPLRVVEVNKIRKRLKFWKQKFIFNVVDTLYQNVKTLYVYFRTILIF